MHFKSADVTDVVEEYAAVAIDELNRDRGIEGFLNPLVHLGADGGVQQRAADPIG